MRRARAAALAGLLLAGCGGPEPAPSPDAEREVAAIEGIEAQAGDPDAPVAVEPAPPPARVEPATPARPLEIKVRAVVRGAPEPQAVAPDAVPAVAEGAAPRGDLVSELERLGRLRAAGALSDEELALAKSKLLGGSGARPAS